jgi:peptide/nickel transport system substrate-binding protein
MPEAPEEAAPSEEEVSAEAPAAEETAVEETAAEEGEAMVINHGELNDFNSWNCWRMSGVNQILANLVYSRLIYKDVEGQVHGDLAKEWEMADDGLSLTFHLKEGVKWHDGRDFSAEDFVTMYEYTKDPDLQDDPGIQKIAGVLSPVTNVVAEDPLTLRLEFDQPVPYIYDAIDYWYAILIDDKEDVAMQKGLAMGTGPFVMKEWKPDEYARFDKNPDFYESDYPLADTVYVRRFDAAEALIPNVQAGALHHATGIGFADIETIDADPELEARIGVASWFANCVVNTNMSPTDDVRVRQALNYAMNRKEYVDNVLFGVPKVTCSPFALSSSIAYREDMVDYYPFDLDKAKALLEEAGVPEGTEINLVTSLDPNWTLCAQVWQADLAKIGITLNIEEVESAEYYEIHNDRDVGGYHLQMWGTGRLTRDPAIFFNTQQEYFGGENNTYGWVNEEYAELIEKAKVELDEEKRREMYQRLNEIIVIESPMIQFHTGVGLSVAAKKLKGLTEDLIGTTTFWHAYIED